MADELGGAGPGAGSEVTSPSPDISAPPPAPSGDAGAPPAAPSFDPQARYNELLEENRQFREHYVNESRAAATQRAQWEESQKKWQNDMFKAFAPDAYAKANPDSPPMTRAEFNREMQQWQQNAQVDMQARVEQANFEGAWPGIKTAFPDLIEAYGEVAAWKMVIREWREEGGSAHEIAGRFNSAIQKVLTTKQQAWLAGKAGARAAIPGGGVRTGAPAPHVAGRDGSKKRGMARLLEIRKGNAG